MWPFKNKQKQKKTGIILTVIGVAVMVSQFNLPLITLFLTTAQFGLIIATVGVIYLLEAVS